MTERVLLVDIGAGELPAMTPVVPVYASWLPVVAPPAGLAPPTGVVSTPVADGVLLQWTGLGPYEHIRVEIAPAPAGPWTPLAEVHEGTQYLVTLPAGATEARVVRVKAGIDSAPVNLGTVTPNLLTEVTADMLAEAAADATAKANAAKAEATARANALQAQINDVVGTADDWTNANPYPAGDSVRYSGHLYRAKTAVPGNTPPPNETYWQDIGNYASVGEAVAAAVSMGVQNASDIETESSRVDGMLARFPVGTGGLASEAMVADEAAARANADGALSSRTSLIEARMPTGTGSLASEARVIDAENASATRDSAISGRVSGVEARMPTGTDKLANEARVVAAEDASVGRDNALGSRVTTVEARMPAGSGALATSAQVVDEATARANADGALGSRTSVIEARMPTGTDTLANEARVVVAENASVGRDNALGVRTSAIEATVNNPETGVEATAGALEETRARVEKPNPNMLPNPTFAFGFEGWNTWSSNGTTALIGGTSPNDIWGPRAAFPPNSGATMTVSKVLVGLNPGSTYTISFEGENNSNTGLVYVNGVAQDAAGNTAGNWIAPAVIPSGELYNQRRSITFTLPAGADRFYFQLLADNTNNWVAFRRVKLEVGGIATVYSEDGAIHSQAGKLTALTAEVAGKAEGSVVEQVLVDIEALEKSNPNLIPNGAFLKDTNGWALGPGVGRGSDDNGTYIAAGPVSGTSVTGGPSFIVPAAELVMTLSAEVIKFGAAGVAWIDVLGATGEGVAPSYDGPDAGIVAGDFFTRRMVTFTKPAGITVLWPRLIIADTDNLVGATKFKLEVGSRFTGFNDAATVAATVSQTSALNLAVGGVNGAAVSSTSLTYRTGVMEASKVEFLKVGNKVTGYRIGNDGLATNFELVADSIELMTGASTGVTITRNKMDRVFGSAAFYEGDPWGSDSLVMWIGPASTAKSAATKANATMWMDNTGKSGYGGSVIKASNVKTASATTDSDTITATVATFTKDPASTQRKITAEFSFNSNKTANINDGFSEVRYGGSFVVEVSIDGGAWTTIQTAGINGVNGKYGEPGFTPYVSYANGKVVLIHNAGGTTFSYRVRQNSGIMQAVPGGTTTRMIAIEVVEQ
ncbi:hypothetical protein DCD74_02520 [Lysobacter oculi]|uniref:Chitin-binding type-3 domain-containing protein n=1 Tax=Solilutibacter oculi TaxID=2698682 RepID=A0A344J3V7_9GAMM|nr:hypothetical protein [Lysobacter oculi]AXA83717.1 hypothetical protein DCD74_02520 [Lysobacter oculi]